VDRLDSPADFVDFGPSALQLTAGSLQLQRVEGRRTAALRRGVRSTCPRHPGIYGMIDQHGELVYVGKAKNLRARLLSYFRPRSRDPKAGRIVGQARSVAWESCADEFAALHRELELIRRWRPRFNIQGKPHRWQQTYVCLGRAPAPYVFLAPRPPLRAVACFGPIAAGLRAREAVRRLNDWFQLRDCPQAQVMAFADQADLFPVNHSPGCLRHELGTCLGPCAAACSRDRYAQNVRAAREFLAGRDRSPLVHLERAMQEAAAAEVFERAAVLRDKLTALTWLEQQLDQRRQANAMPTTLYPVVGHNGSTVWYVLHSGRAVAALSAANVPEDTSAISALAADRVRRGRPGDQVAGMLLMGAWFRRRPEERRRLVPLTGLEEGAARFGCPLI
jgi:excinuclease ABC subunit C